MLEAPRSTPLRSPLEPPHRRLGLVTVHATLLWAVLIWASPLAQPAGAQQILVPLSDLGTNTYLGFAGGLYDDGSNTPPAALRNLANQALADIVPRDAAGRPDDDGRIGFMAVGMSNTNQEFRHFERSADLATERDPRLVVVDTAVAGRALEHWLDESNNVWTTVDSRLTAAGLSAEQVQVAWMKQLHAVPPTRDFPEHAEVLRDDLLLLVERLRQRFPNLALIYASNRIYGGYDPTNPNRDEPFTYEVGFGVKWAVAGQPALQGDPSSRPIVLWGPDLWANGPTPRSDGLAWLPEDLEADGTHPSELGERKVAGLLERHFRCQTAWWPQGNGLGIQVLNAVADAHVDAERPTTPLGLESTLAVRGVPSPVMRSYLRFDLSSLAGFQVVHAKLSLLNDVAIHTGIQVWTTDGEPWDESTITFAESPGAGEEQTRFSTASNDGSLQADITELVANAVGGVLDLALVSAAPALDEVWARESGIPPRLVVSYVNGSSFGDGFECGGTGRWSRVSE